MANDRWMSFVNVFPKDLTIDGFLDDLAPHRDDEMLVTSHMRHAQSGIDMHYISRSLGGDPDSYVRAYISVYREEGNEYWGMLMDGKGSYPRKLSRDILGAIGLPYGDFADRVDVVTALGNNLSTGASIFDEQGYTGAGLANWMDTGSGLLLVITSFGGAKVTETEMRRYIPDFYSPVVPSVEVDTLEGKKALEEILGTTLKNDSITVLSRADGASVTIEGSFSRRDKAVGRKVAKMVDTLSANVMDQVATLMSAPALPAVAQSAPEAEPEVTFEVDPDMQRRVAELERTNRTLSRENRELSKENHALRRERSNEVEPDAEHEVVESVTPTRTVTFARAITLDRQGEVFDTFDDVVRAASKLDHVRVSPSAADDIEDVQNDKRSPGWRAFTWSALLAMNEYGEALRFGTFSGNFYEFLRNHPHPPVSPKRLAIRESDTVRTNDKLMALRTFLADGTKVPMESHFKIDASGKHPAPRMHFAVIDGVVYVGYIGRHLRNQSTN